MTDNFQHARAALQDGEKETRLDPATIEACAKVAETCAVRFSIVLRGKLQDQIDIARQDISARIRSLSQQSTLGGGQ